MKPIVIISIVILSMVFFSNAVSQVKVGGWLQSNVYAWENLQENQQWDFYQGLQLRVTPQQFSDLYANTFLRVAYRGDPAEWEERVYNMYLNWGNTRKYRVRVGRQFLYRGVMNGTVDAVELSGTFFKKFRAVALVGTEAPYERPLKIRNWDNGNVMGGFLSYRMPWQNSFEVSYFQKQRWSDLYWQLLGATFHGYLGNNLNYYFRYDHNLLSESYQEMTGRLTYYAPKWSAGLEYNSLKPKIYEDSFFNIFEVNPHNQIRAIFDYRLNSDWSTSLQLLHTVYNPVQYYILFKDTDDNRVIVSMAHRRFGALGLIYQNGYGGENIGYYADIRYEFMPNWTARLFNSFYKYERAFTSISQDALAFSVGLQYRLQTRLLIDAEIQQQANGYFDSDYRGLFRLTYLFQY
jgi:hypothetical protein